MSMHNAFLADIIAHPADDTPRLIYADWLEEHPDNACTTCMGAGRILDSGNEWWPHPDCKRCRASGRVSNGNAERAKFIRVQIELAKLGECERDFSAGLSCCCCPFCAAGGYVLRRREREMLQYHHWRCGEYTTALTAGYSAPDRPIYKLFPPGGGAEIANVEYRRGFVAEVTLPLGAWMGERCPACAPEQEAYQIGADSRCVRCHGSGRLPGHGAALYHACPLERVTLSDREPDMEEDGLYRWYYYDPPNEADALPTCFRGTPQVGESVCESRQEALDLASRRALQWARYAAELTTPS